MERLNRLTEQVIGAAIQVHKALGPGLLEFAYEACLAYELREMGLRVESQKALPISYRGVQLDCGYRLDLLVEEILIVELKVVEKLLQIHTAQLLSYLKLSSNKLGLLINFNVNLLKNGVVRIAN